MYVEQEEAVSSFAIESGVILFTDYEYKHGALRRINEGLCASFMWYCAIDRTSSKGSLSSSMTTSEYMLRKRR